MSYTLKENVEKLVEDADPHDGFRVRDVVVGDEHSLHLVFHRGGVPVELPWRLNAPLFVEVWKANNPAPAQIGEKRRLLLLLEAVCRYMNTCGDWTQLEAALSMFSTMLGGDLKLNLCGEFTLVDSCLTTAGTFEHVFTSEHSQWAIVWSDEEFFDVVSLAELVAELHQQEEDEPHVIGGGIGAGESFGEDIPRRSDHRQLETVEDKAGEDVSGSDAEG